jgi:DNA-binding transcriptional LysR family regulator
MERLISKLPPHKALIAFEAVLRLGTVTAAAKELTSTQPAISQHLKNLEVNLDTVLFSRQGRLLKPTESALKYYAIMEPLLVKMAEASEHLRTDINTHNSVNIISNSGLAHFWLLPMLPALQAQFPNLSINVTLSDAQCSAANNALVIGFGEVSGATVSNIKPVKQHNLQRTILFAEEVCAVCSIDYAKKHNLGLESTISEIMQQPLIHMDEYESRWLNWRDWLQFFGHRLQKPEHIIFLGNYFAVITATQAGQGVALGWRCLMQHLLDQKQLVQVSGEAIRREGYGYYIETHRDNTDNYRLVSDYLVSSAQAT